MDDCLAPLPRPLLLFASVLMACRQSPALLLVLAGSITLCSGPTFLCKGCEAAKLVRATMQHLRCMPQTRSITAPKTAHTWHVFAVLSGWCKLLPLWLWLHLRRAEEGHLSHVLPLLSVDH